MTKPPFKTWIENAEGKTEQTNIPADQAPAPVFQDPVYATPDDVPVPLRHALKAAFESGLTVEHLAVIYDNIPEPWIEEFVSQKPPDPENP